MSNERRKAGDRRKNRVDAGSILTGHSVQSSSEGIDVAPDPKQLEHIGSPELQDFARHINEMLYKSGHRGEVKEDAGIIPLVGDSHLTVWRGPVGEFPEGTIATAHLDEDIHKRVVISLTKLEDRTVSSIAGEAQSVSAGAVPAGLSQMNAAHTQLTNKEFLLMLRNNMVTLFPDALIFLSGEWHMLALYPTESMVGIQAYPLSDNVNFQECSVMFTPKGAKPVTKVKP